MVSSLEHTNEGTHGGDARGEHLAVFGVLEVAQAGVQLVAGGVSAAGVVEPIVEFPDGFLVESGGQVDGGGHRA